MNGLQRILKNIFIVSITLLFYTSVSSQVGLNWVRQMGGVASDEGLAITIDGSGNIYTTGGFNDTVDFDPGAGVFNLISNGSDDIFISKLDPQGNFLWAKSMGGAASFDQGLSIAIDSLGNVYTTGRYNGTVDFNPGAGDSTITWSGGGSDIFITKLDSNGNFIWARSIGGTNTDMANSITINNLGELLLTGEFRGTVDFNPGPGVDFLSGGDADLFILNLDLEGDFNWAKRIGGFSGSEVGHSITTDNLNNIYTTGRFRGTVDFDPNVGVSNLSAIGPDDDIFVLKLNPVGNFIWAKRMGNTGKDQGLSLNLDRDNNVYTTGRFSFTVDFNPGADTLNFTSLGSSDLFISKLDSAGNFLWARSFGSSGAEIGAGIATDTSGNVYTTGYYQNTVDFDPGAGVANVTASGIIDCYVSKLDSAGDFVWVKSIGDIVYSEGITVDTKDAIFITGSFQTDADFDPSAGQFILNSNGSDDVFTLKLAPCSNSFISFSDTACNTYTSPSGKVWTNSNTYNDTIANAAGCDSVITINLTINNNTNGTDTRTECDSLVWIDGNTYTSDNNSATFNIVSGAANSCDSLVTLDLTIINSISGTDTRTECDSLVWIDGNTYTANNNSATFNIIGGAANSCDSLVTLDLTIINSSTGTDTRTECDSLVWIDGNTYTSNNNSATFNIVGGAANSCDSLVTLDLTIINSTSGTDTRTECDSLVWIDGNTYTSNNNSATFNIVGGATNSCDSLVTLDLTIINSTSGTDTRTECDSLVWIDGNTYTSDNNSATFNIVGGAANSCDSLVILDLTIINSSTGTDTRTECDSLVWIDGNTYTSNNNMATFNIVGGAANSCDSLVTLNLTIVTIDTSITSSNDSLIVNEAASSYQWIDCLNGDTSITGETNQTFIPQIGGDYAVLLTKNGCSDTSRCISVFIDGINEVLSGNSFHVYPNPTTGNLFVFISEDIDDSFSIVVQNSLGQMVQRIHPTEQLTTINMEGLDKGLFFINVVNSKETKTRKIIKQ